MLSFAEETTKQEIEFIQFKHIRISFKVLYHFIFTIATENDVDYEDTEQFLKKIQELFETKYKHIHQQGFLGEVSIFNNFAQNIEKTLGKKSKNYGIIQGSAESLMKYLDVIKKDWVNVKNMIKQKLQNPYIEFREPQIKIISMVKNKIETTVSDVK